MAERLHVRLDRDLQKGIASFAKQSGLTTSQAARELLRQALQSPPEPVSRGWREGFAQGYADHQRATLGVAQELSGAGPKRVPWMAAASRKR